ncbi:kinesin-like protein KIN-7D [Citrus sinensis]|nr:kinesin-like protein KIN-7D [Citrus sinensis]
MHESIKCAGAGTVVDPIHHRHSPLLQPLLADAETEKTKLAPRLLVISQFTNNIFVESGTGKSHPSHGKLSSSPTVQSSRRLLFGSDPTSPCEVTDTFSSPPPPPPSPSILFFTNLFASSRLRVAESTQLNTMASSSRARSSSPFSYRKPVTPYSSTSSTSSSFMNNRLMPRSCSTSASSYFNSGNGLGSRSMTPSRSCSDSMYNSPRGYSARAAPPVIFPSEELMAEPLDAPQRSGDSISVTIRFRPLSEREFQRGDEIAWYADGDKIVRNEYNPATAYAFDRVFGPHANSQEVYDVAARPVVKAAMEGVNGTVFAYGVTSSGKTHTMHGDHNSPGIIPLAIKDVFSIIQDVINDLLDPTGQNLRVREDAQGTYVEGIKEEVVLSPGHALSFIAAGEEHRHVGSNNFNLLSSRSHTIFTLMIESSDHGDEYDGVIFSQLNLIDLAGSESSKTETTGLRRKEGSYINKSLLTLGTVIGKLSEGKASHVPYRDSKLTRLLQSSLSGHGHVSVSLRCSDNVVDKMLICTVTPASSSMEETHNTLKFASRAKRVEIYASRNKLEEGQVKMQSRLEEEEEAKAALMSRIQRLTKLILVSTKNTIPGLSDVPNHQRSHSVGEDDLDLLREGSLLLDGENQKDSTSSASGLASDLPSDFKHRRSSSKWNEEFSPTSSTVTESTQAGELISGSKHPIGGMTSDQMDLLVEQVKMLAGEIAFSSSNLKRLVDQSVNDPDGSKVQIQNLEREIQEKRRQMRILEQRIIENGEASMANASMVDMQQTVTRLMSQCNEKAFELEIKSADNRILQEQLQNKCSENKKLQEKVNLLEQQLACQNGDKSAGSSGQGTSDEYVDELRKKVQSQETENEKLKLEHVQLSEENSGLHVQNQKLAEEASYAKELASAAAVELKNLAGEVTKISLQNAKLEKELLAARESMHSRGAAMQTVNGVNRKYSDGMKAGRKGRLSGRSTEISGVVSDDFDSWNLDPDDLKLELQARKQREAALEAALAEKEFLEDEYRKKVEESKRREEALENDLANMWVLVAKLKKEVGSVPELSTVERQRNGEDCVCDPKANETDCNTVLKDRHFLEVSKPADENSVERQVLDVPKPADETPKEEPLVARLKCVNLVRLLVQSVQFVVQRFQIGFLHSLDRAIHALKMEGLLSFASLAFSVQQRVQFFY